MAKRRLKPEQLSRYLSFVDPVNTGLSLNDDDEDKDKSKPAEGDSASQGGGINNVAGAVRKRVSDSIGGSLAGGSSITPGAPPPTTNVVTPTTVVTNAAPSTLLRPSLDVTQIRPDADFPVTSLPSFAREQRNIELSGDAARINPLLVGGADLSRVAASMLQDAGNLFTPARGVASPDVGANVSAGERRETPEDKLLVALANANPTPQSFWRRLLAGAIKGASQVTPDDTLGSAFGKIAGNVVARSFPAVDSAQQFEENKRRAVERYQVESVADKAKQQRATNAAQIADLQLRRRGEEEDRAERVRQNRLLDAARLRDDKRAEADLRLKALKDLPEESEQRDVIANELQTNYGINVDRSYGLVTKASDKEPSEDAIRKRATSEVMAEIGATVEKIARDSTNNKPHIIKAREEMEKVTNDPNASAIKKAQAREDFEKLYDRELKANIDFTRSDVENRIRKREQLLRGASARATPAATTRQPRGKRGSKVQASKGSKVQASKDARATNFAGTVLRIK